MPTPRKEDFDYPGMKGDKTVKPKGYVHAQVCWCACQEYSKGTFANLMPTFSLIPALLLTKDVTWGKSLTFCRSHFLHL